jgi:hypothetical protein
MKYSVRGWTRIGDKFFVAMKNGVLIIPADGSYIRFIANSFYDADDYR